MDPDEVAFSIEVEAGAGGTTVRPRGELDMATQGELRAVLEQHGSGPVTLDLGVLQFIDTSGLRLILETAETARRAGAPFIVLRGRPAVMRLFDVAGVTDLIPFADPDRGAP